MQRDLRSITRAFQKVWQEKWILAINNYVWKRPGLPRLTVSHQCISVFTGCSLGTVGSASSLSARESEHMPQYRALKGLSSMFTVLSRKEHICPVLPTGV